MTACPSTPRPSAASRIWRGSRSPTTRSSICGARLNAILAFVEQLSEVDVAGVEPMTSVTPMAMKKRADVVTDGGDADAVLRNAPATGKATILLVPKVVE